MARADDDHNIGSDVNDDTELATDNQYQPVAKLSSSSFRSATSYASFRSCRSIKSYNSRASFKSFKSAVSRNNSYNSYNFYSCEDDMPVARTGLVNEGYQDNVSFYSFNDAGVSPKSLILSSAPGRLRSVSDSVLHSFVSENNDDIDSMEKNSKKSETAAIKRRLGYILVILAGVCIASSAYCYHLSPSLPIWSVLMYRSVVQLILSLVNMILTKSNPFGPPGSRWQLLGSGLLNSLLVLSLYLTMSRTTSVSALCGTIMLLTPVITNIISSFMCGEHVGIFRLLTLCVHVAGTLLVTRPGPMFPQSMVTVSLLQHDITTHNIYGYPSQFTHEDSIYESDIIGIVAAVVVTVLSGFLFNLNRQCRGASFSVIMFWSSLGSVAMSAIGLYALTSDNDGDIISIRAGREIPDTNIVQDTYNNITVVHANDPLVSPNRIFEGTTEWLVATLISFLGIFATIIVIKVLQYIEPGKVSLLQTSHIVTGYILVTTTLQTSGWGLLDLAGVILIILTVVAALIEENIIDVKRWKWF